MTATFDTTTLSHTSPPPASLKRKRADSDTQPLTPPLAANDPEGSRLLSRAVNVLSTAATALSQVTFLYESDHVARDGLLRAVEVLTKVNQTGGKLIICGVGKSGLVGRKMVATMKSLGIASSFMHAAEALHGDLGDIRKVSRHFNAYATRNILTENRMMQSCSYPTLARQRSSWPSSSTYLPTRLSSPSHHIRNPQNVLSSTIDQIPYCCPRPYTS